VEDMIPVLFWLLSFDCAVFACDRDWMVSQWELLVEKDGK
jgi:hypothetical protein